MTFRGTRHRSSILWPLEIFIIQKTKPAPPSYPAASVKAEAEGEKARKPELVGPVSLAPGREPFSSNFTPHMKALTLSSSDHLAENGCIYDCFFFFFLFYLTHVLVVFFCDVG